MSLYGRVARPLLFRLEPERAHRLAMAALRAADRLPGRPPRLDPILRTEALGLSFPSPIGLAAGLDKDAQAPHSLLRLGFGFVEVGTVTARPQPGNPPPRLFRLPQDQALLNRMGFNNDGAEAVARRLARRDRRAGIVAVNVGKSRAAPLEQAADDHAASARLLAPLADLLVVNVSSPNTPGLRDLQATDRLRPVLAAVQRAAVASGPAPPILVKIAPDLADAEVDAVADLALDLGLAGVVATNTTAARDGLRTDAGHIAALGGGGISGPPLRDRSLAVLRRLRARAGDRLVLVGAGGVASGQDAWERIAAGATLVEVYTAFVYDGPAAPRRIARELAEIGRLRGLERVQDAVGIENDAIPLQME